MFDFLDVDPPVEALLKEAKQEGVNLFGAGNFAHAVMDALKELGVRVHAFVVSTPDGDICGPVPVLGFSSLDEFAKSRPLWIAVYNRSAAADLIAIANMCRSRGIKRVILPQEYYEVVQHQLGWRFWLTDRRRYADARESIESAYALLSDETSQKNFLATLRFRLATPTEGTPLPSTDTQYFPAEISAKLQANERGNVFVDGGAYDGDTLIHAAAKIPLARVYAFEPDLANFNRLALNSRQLKIPVVNFPCGLSAQSEWLAFAGDNGEASSVSPEGNIRIQCVSLDECLVGEHIDYLKLDIEGHELAALAGAHHFIAKDQPILAIAAYHHWDDLWRIPLAIHKLCLTYKIFYRIHEHNTFDSVYYAL
jgi:FkbM family methyltransferase